MDMKIVWGTIIYVRVLAGKSHVNRSLGILQRTNENIKCYECPLCPQQCLFLGSGWRVWAGHVARMGEEGGI
jgi:hypothetical protein